MLIEDGDPDFRKHRERIDKALTPEPTYEEAVQMEADRRAALEETWGMSAEAQAGAAKMMAWAGAEG